MKERVAQLLVKPMDRKEFLRLSGAGLLMLFGGSAIIQALSVAQKHGSTVTSGYGAAEYGGPRPTQKATNAVRAKA